MQNRTRMSGSRQIKFNIDTSSNMPKFRMLVDAVNRSVSEGSLKVGDALPSVNQLCADLQLSRDTVFKAYTLLKEQGTIESVPNKGYFIADQIQKVFVFLDTFKAYKEVLYDSFVKNLPKNVIADVNFHHYNARVFKKLIDESYGRYSKYIIMPFNDEIVRKALEQIPSERLLIVDWNLYSSAKSNVLYQDFGESLTCGLSDVLHLLKRYKELHILYPEYTNHPHESVDCVMNFCKQNGLQCAIETDSSQFDIHAGIAYFSVSDRMLGRFLEQCRNKKLEPGTDVGIISYNETPMKKFIYKGITVFSTDFELMGRKAAEFVMDEKQMNFCVPSKMIIRESL